MEAAMNISDQSVLEYLKSKGMAEAVIELTRILESEKDGDSKNAVDRCSPRNSAKDSPEVTHTAASGQEASKVLKEVNLDDHPTPPRTPSKELQDKINRFNNSKPAADIPERSSPFLLARKTTKINGQREGPDSSSPNVASCSKVACQDDKSHQRQTGEKSNASSPPFLNTRDKISKNDCTVEKENQNVAHDTADHGSVSEEEDPSPRRSWKVKRVIPNHLYRREDLEETPATNKEDCDMLTAESTTNASTHIHESLDENNKQEKDSHSPAQDHFDSQNEGKNEEGEENETPRRSWKAKRILSAASFRRENPNFFSEQNKGRGSVNTKQAISQDLASGAENGGSHLSQTTIIQEDDDDVTTQRSWRVKRVIGAKTVEKENQNTVTVASPPSTPKCVNKLQDQSVKPTPLSGGDVSRIALALEHLNRPLCQRESEHSASTSNTPASTGLEGRKHSQLKQIRSTSETDPLSNSMHSPRTNKKALYSDSARNKGKHVEDEKVFEQTEKSITPITNDVQSSGGLDKIPGKAGNPEPVSADPLNDMKSMMSLPNIEDEQPKQRNWKIKRVIDVDTFKRENSIENPRMNDHLKDRLTKLKTGGGIGSARQNSLEGILSPRVMENKKPLYADTPYITSPIPEKETFSSRSTEEKFSPRSPDTPAVIKSVPSLKDRIGMFNKNQTMPDVVLFGRRPAFLSAKHMKKLIIKEVEPTQKPIIIGEIDSSPVVRPPRTPKRFSEHHVEGKAAITNTVDLKKMTLKDLLPPPKKSLDVRKEEAVRRKVERLNSFDRRGRLRASRSALVDQKAANKKDVFLPVSAKPVQDLSTFSPPEFPKDDEAVKIIKSALRKNFVFDMEDVDIEKFVNAFEQIVVDQGETIIKQGDVGDYFYVVGYGEVSFYVNEQKTGSTKAGNSFGEMSLLYTCPRAATVKADYPSTKLYRVDQKTFRFVMQAQTKESEEKKEKLLRDISFLQHLSEEDLHRLSSVMAPCIFNTGDYIVKRGERGDSFYIIQEGRVRVTDIVVGNTQYEDVTLEAGDYFGEGALISSESRAASVVALTQGTAFAIDRTTFQKVLGDFVKLILKAQDRHRLEGIKIIRDSNLTAQNLEKLTSRLVDQEFEAHRTIFKEGETVEGALYLVRQGVVKISTNDSSRVENILPGGYFGQEQLLADTHGRTTLAQYFATAGDEDCICGVLSLKECRSVFDTTEMEAGAHTGGSSYRLSKRESLGDVDKMNISLEDLRRDSLLGDGQFAEVWRVSTDVEDCRRDYALKVQNADDVVRQDNAMESIRREITVLRQLHHPCIVNLISTFEKEDGSIYMLMEAVDGGELWNVIHKKDDKGEWVSGLSEAHTKFYALVLADTIAYMHREKFIMRDLKPENILIGKDGYPILVDFGFAKYCPFQTYTFCGTPNYLAPEIVTNRGHGAGVDHWALGIVTYEMLTGENPFYFEDMDQMALFQAIVQEPFYPLPESSNSQMVDFITGLLEKEPAQRLGMLAGRERDILKHDWFADLDLEKVRSKDVVAPWVPP